MEPYKHYIYAYIHFPAIPLIAGYRKLAFRNQKNLAIETQCTVVCLVVRAVPCCWFLCAPFQTLTGPRLTTTSCLRRQTGRVGCGTPPAAPVCGRYQTPAECRTPAAASTPGLATSLRYPQVPASLRLVQCTEEPLCSATLLKDTIQFSLHLQILYCDPIVSLIQRTCDGHSVVHVVCTCRASSIPTFSAHNAPLEC